MKIRLMSLTIGLLTIVSLTACGKRAPECSAPETKSLVYRIARDHFNSGLAQIDQLSPLDLGLGEEVFSLTDFKLESIRTQSVDKETGKCSCAGDLEINIQGMMNKLQEQEGDNVLLNLYINNIKAAFNEEAKNGVITKTITYSSELTDDSKKFYVTVRGLDD